MTSAGARSVDPHRTSRLDAWVPLYADILRDWLADGESVRLPVRGTSMHPTIDSGASIVVRACRVSAMRVGDIVVYESGDRVVCHRLLRRRRTPDGWRVLTGGDAVRLPGAWVPASALIGRVTAIEAHGRRRRLDDRRERLRALVAAAGAWTLLLVRRLARATARTPSPVGLA
jgi:signal peptidase I